MSDRAITEYSTFVAEFETQFARMVKGAKPTFITRRGKTVGVVMSPKKYDEYAALAHEADQAHRAIQEGLRQIDAGEVIPWETAKKRLLARRGKRVQRTSARRK